LPAAKSLVGKSRARWHADFLIDRSPGECMGTVLPFKAERHSRDADESSRARSCEIVIFPGVRIERVGDVAGPDTRRPLGGRGKLDGTNGPRRPRKTS
jgi:hypothetical protein